MKLRLYIITGALLAMTAVAPATTANYKVIVHASNDQGSISKHDLFDIFMKKKKTWDSGVPIVVVDQEVKSPTREAFSSAVLGKSVAAIKSYWQQLIFSGREVPPVEVVSDNDVVAFVRANPGSIGYIEGHAAVSGVKILDVQ